MLDLDRDLREVFYGHDFALPFSIERQGAVVGTAAGILGVIDDEALDGRVIAAERTLRLPSIHDLRDRDVLISQADEPTIGVRVGDRFRVLAAPQRVNDGSEMEALLGSVKP
ncbi:hypothetical protein [Delftia acidovorans]|uniref:hypothetical protein n=1 Tax=Delftia acidovorans TaxID=80866 RepID=UPI00241C53E7|nr:hypothetical protein [Delftia acidovorans]